MTEKETFPDGEVSRDAKPDETLMKEYAAGSQGAFEILYARYKGALYRYFLRQLGGDRANDCFQELWLRLIRARNSYKPTGSFRGYLYTLAHNILMDEHRKAMRNPLQNPQNIEEIVNGAELLDEVIDRTRLQRMLYQLLLALPFAQREAWVLRQETEMNTRDIAKLTGSSEEGVKSRLRYATSKLKAGLEQYVSRD